MNEEQVAHLTEAINDRMKEIIEVESQFTRIRDSRRDAEAMAQRKQLVDQHDSLTEEIKTLLAMKEKALETRAAIQRVAMMDAALHPPVQPAPLAHPASHVEPHAAKDSTRFPSGLPTFMESMGKDRPMYKDPVHFTRVFAATITAHGLGVENNWERLLHVSIDNDRYHWATENVFNKNLSWVDFTTLLHKHYGQPNLKRQLKSQLINMTMNHGESVLEFGDRFKGVMVSAGFPDSKEYAELFIEKLPVRIKAIVETAIDVRLDIDLAGPLPTTDRGNNYLFIAVDICTRFCFLRPMTDKTSATTVIHLIDHFTTFGFPRILQSDNGTEFVNELMKLLKETAGFDHRLITPYHAAANGTAERWVQNALNIIRKMIDGARHDWDLYVPAAQYSINIKIAARHGCTPFTLMFNRSPNGFSDFTGALGLQPFDGEAYAERIKNFAEVIFPAINDKVQKYIEVSTKNRHLVSFPDGSFVMAVNKSRTNKLEPRYEGPFKVLRRNKGGAYVLQDTDGVTLPRNYTTEELKLISHDPDKHGTSFVIEKILDHRGSAPNYQYLVKWKDYSTKFNTWEPTDSFDSPVAIDTYWTKLKESHKRKGGDVVTGVRHKAKSAKARGKTN